MRKCTETSLFRELSVLFFQRVALLARSSPVCHSRFAKINVLEEKAGAPLAEKGGVRYSIREDEICSNEFNERTHGNKFLSGNVDFVFPTSLRLRARLQS